MTRYEYLFHTCEVLAGFAPEVANMAAAVLAHKQRYVKTVSGLNVPWYVLAGIHMMESSFRFDCHLHNGDPLTTRTVHVPRGRPRFGKPPYRWEVSALDALEHAGLLSVHNWSLPVTLNMLERYNGLGYQKYHPTINTPYLWSMSNHYTSGKYGADGKFDPSLVSKQCGIATLYKFLESQGVLTFV